MEAVYIIPSTNRSNKLFESFKSISGLLSQKEHHKSSKFAKFDGEISRRLSGGRQVCAPHTTAYKQTSVQFRDFAELALLVSTRWSTSKVKNKNVEKSVSL